ncbi:NAD(P)H-dependent glycerol-3-phosphate dehydrogenase [soil metagenome]
MKQPSPIAVIGAGSWGTALAILLAYNGTPTHLWGHNPEAMREMRSSRYNSRYLPDIALPENLQIHTNLADALIDVTDLLVAVPSHAFRQTLQAITMHQQQNFRIASATKGLDPSTNKLLHEVVAEIFGLDTAFAMLSGPTFAKEVALGLPTAITLASNNNAFAHDLKTRLNKHLFRVYTSHDILGVEIGGAIKNVLAIAVGISDGLGFGANARSALITRGLAEIMRLGFALGAQRDTFMGLAGMGDLILTCTDNQSRNRRFGLALGKGATIHSALQSINQVVEGLPTAATVHQLAQKLHIEMPISEQVYRVLHQGLSPMQAVQSLFARETKAE